MYMRYWPLRAVETFGNQYGAEFVVLNIVPDQIEVSLKFSKVEKCRRCDKKPKWNKHAEEHSGL